jgi:hypothetical protein
MNRPITASGGSCPGSGATGQLGRALALVEAIEAAAPVIETTRRIRLELTKGLHLSRLIHIS